MPSWLFLCQPVEVIGEWVTLPSDNLASRIAGRADKCRQTLPRMEKEMFTPECKRLELGALQMREQEIARMRYLDDNRALGREQRLQFLQEIDGLHEMLKNMKQCNHIKCALHYCQVGEHSVTGTFQGHVSLALWLHGYSSLGAGREQV